MFYWFVNNDERKLNFDELELEPTELKLTKLKL